jgi:hypothetical protein
MNIYSLRKRSFMVAALLGAAAVLIACNPIENQSQSATLLVVENMLGTDHLGNNVNFLESDVVSGDAAAPIYVSDMAIASLRASSLNPNPLLGVSQYYNIQLTHYAVTFFRSDGHNVPGVDVPYAFEGSVSAMIRVGGTADFPFIIVRQSAKAEPPLINLRRGYPDEVLYVTAKVDFYGHDLANRNVTTTGYLPVNFANYADLVEGGGGGVLPGRGLSRILRQSFPR